MTTLILILKHWMLVWLWSQTQNLLRWHFCLYLMLDKTWLTCELEAVGWVAHGLGKQPADDICYRGDELCVCADRRSYAAQCCVAPPVSCDNIRLHIYFLLRRPVETHRHLSVNTQRNLWQPTKVQHLTTINSYVFTERNIVFADPGLSRIAPRAANSFGTPPLTGGRGLGVWNPPPPTIRKEGLGSVNPTLEFCLI